MTDLQTEIREAQGAFTTLRDRTGIDADFACREQDGQAYAVSCTRIWNKPPISYDGPLADVKIQTVSLWTRMLRDALLTLEGTSTQ